MPSRPPVVSSARTLSSWLIALGGLVVYAVGLFAVHVAQVPLELPLPWWVLQALPVVAYAAMLALVARPAPWPLLGGVAVLWAAHLVVGTASWTVLQMLDGGVTAPTVMFPPPPFPELVWVPLLLLPLRDLLTGRSRRHHGRAPVRDRRPLPERRISPAPVPSSPRPTPSPRLGAPASSRATSIAAPPAVTAMEMPPIDTRMEPAPPLEPGSTARCAELAAPDAEPVPATVGALSVQEQTSDSGLDAPEGRLNELLARDVSDEPLRVSFDRVSSQLPPAMFAVPIERVAAELREPGVVSIDRRTVLAQLETGVVRARWAAIAEQFPAHVLAAADDTSGLLPDQGQLVLPIDELVSQLPPELFVSNGPEPEVYGIEEFPAPFQPLSTCEAVSRPQPQDPVVPAVPPAHAVEHAVSECGYAQTAAGDPEADWAAESAIPSTVVHDAADVPQLGAAPEPRPWSSAAPLRAATSDIAGMLSRALPPIGPLEIDRCTVAGVTLVSASASGLGPEPAVGAARLVLPLLISTDAPCPVQQVTLRAADVAVVLTPVGEMREGADVLAAAIPPGGSLALVEMRCRQVAADAASGEIGTSTAPPDEDDEPDLLDVECPTRVQGIASRLDALGPVSASTLRDAHADRLLYLFLPAGSHVRTIGAFAQKLAGALEHARAAGRAFDVAVVRSGDRCVVIRPPAGGSGRSHTIVAAGQTARPGLAYRQVERAAVALGAP